MTIQDKARKKQSQESISNLNQRVVDAIQDVKGKNIKILDLRELDDRPTNFFIICEGESKTQVRAITQKIKEEVRSSITELPLHVEGTQESKWIVMDYFNTVVHVFHPEYREFYELDQLWSDAKITSVEDVD